MTQTTIITTVKIEYTEAQTIRCVARQDMPEYNILEGSVFYLTRSSKNDGTYYIATWNYERMQWDCRCPATKPCRHNKLISASCSEAHTLQGYKPLSKAEKFAALRLKYDIRYVQAPALPTVIQEAEKVAHLEQLRQGAIAETVFQLQEDERVRNAHYARLEEQRRTATLNGNRAFSILR